jgi:hypothetical protein
MKAVVSMVAAGLLPWACAAAVLGPRANPEVLYGMLGPMTAVLVSWVVVKRVYVANPAGLMGVFVAGIAVKLLFFAAYAVVMLRVLDLRPIPFVASFTCYFVALHNLEALFMRRLFTSEC